MRAEKDRLPIARLIHKALQRTGYDAVLLAEFLGERKLANVYKLIEQARQFDAAGIFTLADFIVQLSQFVARQPDEPLAATQPESLNAVRLMSIHQSKGLEFPVVVVVDLDRKSRPAGDGVAFTPALGPMVRLPECTSGYNLFQQVEAEEDLAELTRLLYVAATRAGDYLILSGGLADLDSPRGAWLDLLRRHFDLRTGKPLESSATEPPTRSTGASALAKVRLEEPPLPKKFVGKTNRQDLSKTIAKIRNLAASGKGTVPDHLRAIAIDRQARRQYSVSRLHGTLRQNAYEPVELADDGAASSVLDPLGLGTLVHAVLADLVAGKDDSAAARESLVRKYASLHLPDVDDLEEPLRLIAGLTATPRWASVRQANCVHAELEFLLTWPPESSLADGSGNGENKQQPINLRGSLFIQGFIDCLYQDVAGDWRLLDYKTNLDSSDGTVAGYKMQMLLYALATERVLRRSPVEVVLHFLRDNREHRFSWDEAARQEAMMLVNDAIERSSQP